MYCLCKYLVSQCFIKLVVTILIPDLHLLAGVREIAGSYVGYQAGVSEIIQGLQAAMLLIKLG